MEQCDQEQLGMAWSPDSPWAGWSTMHMAKPQSSLPHMPRRQDVKNIGGSMYENGKDEILVIV